MQQLRIRLKYYEILELYEWIRDLVHQYKDSSLFAELCSLAILDEWKEKKLEPKLRWINTKQSIFVLQAPLILALMHFIGLSNEPVTTYRGYCLHSLRAIIGDVYQTIE